MTPDLAPAREVASGPGLSGRAGPTGLAGPDGVSPAAFRAVLRRHAATVTVVTAGREAPVGLCATSFTSVSLEPPLVSFCVGLRASAWPTLRVAPKIMVHLLADTQEALARRFAQPGAARFGPPTGWHRGPFDLPTLHEALAWLVLHPLSRTPIGDHVLVVGRVLEADYVAGRRPLLYQDGEFTSLRPPRDGVGRR